jgi:hypothetical protein
MLGRLGLAAVAAAMFPAMTQAGPITLHPPAPSPGADSSQFQPVYRDVPFDPGEGWGMRRTAPVPSPPASHLDRVAGPPPSAEVQAGYLWESHLVQAVAGFTQLDMGPRSATRSLGAPDQLRPPKEDAPGVLGLGLVIRTR